ncbi:MAG: DUF3489 domain-containing protein [Rhizobiaceae bacterium]|nr:DUF3489 domain-containing protein [Rhizobiaceae bacterium]
MDDQNASEPNAKPTDAKRSDRAKASRKRPKQDRPSKTSSGSKKGQLIGLLSKPNGARASVLVERLGWQPHTVRAALSGLRKQGFEVATSKSAKTGETLYAIIGHSAADQQQTAEPAA